MLKIIFISSGSELGGGAKNIFDIVNFVNNKYKVSAIVPSEGLLTRKLEKMGCPAHICKLSLSSIVSLRKIIKSESPDLIYVHGLRASFTGRIAARMAGVPCINAVHGLHYFYYKNPAKKWLYLLGDKFLKRWTHGYICVSKSVFDQVVNVIKADKNKVWLVHNGIDTGQYSFNQKDNLKNDMTISCIGRLQEPKGQIYLLKAVPLIKEKIGDFKCLIVGDGPDRQKLERYADKNNLDNVVFTGKSDDIPSLMLESDILAVPSVWECFPYVLLEAMAAGLPVVATDVGGIPEIVIDGETGILVPAKDERALADAIIELMEKPALRQKMGEAGRKRVLENFTIDKMLEKTMAVYEKVLNI